MECRPYRPEPGPAWSPSRRNRRDSGHNRDPRDAGRPHLIDQPARHAVRLVAAKNLGAVRINFRYASFMSMTAAHSEKAGRDQYFEGPHETYGFRWDEVNPKRIDLQYQPLAFEWLSLTGKRHRLTLDWAVETETGAVVFGEDKASDDFFKDPDVNERLEFAEALLEEHGASLERRVKGGLKNRLERRVVKDIFDARRTAFDADAIQRVQKYVRDAGGIARLADILQVIGGHPALSLDTARAMMHHRAISMPISAPPMPDTPVTMPPPATKGALRAFLAKFVPA